MLKECDIKTFDFTRRYLRRINIKQVQWEENKNNIFFNYVC